MQSIKNLAIFIIFFTSLFVITLPEFCNSSDCGNIPPLSTNWETLPKYEGYFYNKDFGYSVTIPKGLIGRNSPPPAPQHGFGILLSKNPKGYIWVEGSANSLLWESLEQAADETTKIIKDNAITILSVQKHLTKLDHLPAIRLIVKYKCSDSDAILVEDYFIMINAKTGVVYEIALTSESETYGECKNIFESIATSFRVKARQ